MIRSILLSVIASSLGGSVACAATAEALLDRAGARVEQFWEDVSSVTCTETISQQKFNSKGKLVLNAQMDYNYLLSLRWNSGELLVDESRIEKTALRGKGPAGALLATGGFATLLLILHPQFQPGYHFDLRPAETIGTRTLIPVDFIPKADGKSPGALALKGREYPIAWEGTAWIDPATAMVIRMDAHWKQPPQEIALEELSSQVNYSPVTLKNKTYWLPQNAEILLRTPHQRWQNAHRFEGYRLFSVDEDVTVVQPKQEQP